MEYWFEYSFLKCNVLLVKLLIYEVLMFGNKVVGNSIIIEYFTNLGNVLWYLFGRVLIFVGFFVGFNWSSNFICCLQSLKHWKLNPSKNLSSKRNGRNWTRLKNLLFYLSIVELLYFSRIIQYVQYT